MKAAIFLALLLASCAAPDMGASVPKPATNVAPKETKLPDDLILVCFEGFWVVASQSADKAVMFEAKCGPQI